MKSFIATVTKGFHKVLGGHSATDFIFLGRKHLVPFQFTSPPVFLSCTLQKLFFC